MKDKINSIEYESKKYCFYNMEPSSVNLIYLPIFWYSKLIELISDSFSVQMNISYSVDIFKKVFSRYEVLVIEELNDFIEDLINNSNPYTGNNKIILRALLIQCKLKYIKGSFFSFSSLFLIKEIHFLLAMFNHEMPEMI